MLIFTGHNGVIKTLIVYIYQPLKSFVLRNTATLQLNPHRQKIIKEKKEDDTT